MAVLKITKDNFDSLVAQSAQKVLLDFWAPWCGPCKMVGPIVEQIAEENESLTVGKVNVDEEMELAAQFGIASIPTLIVMEHGQITAKTVGFSPKSELENILNI